MIEAGFEPCAGYRLTRLLGRGGFGEVWEGVAKDGDRMAFKFVPTRNQSATVASNEVRQLVQLRELKHPHLVTLRNVIIRPNYLIMAMEQGDGNLYHLLSAYHHETGTHLPPDHLCELLEQAADGLDFLAKQNRASHGAISTGSQHCDVKPSNLLLFGDILKVTDFGLCAPQLNLRHARAFGTPGYAPRELAEGKVSERTDQYSLAVTYLELRLGRMPCKTTSLQKHEKPDLTWVPDHERVVVARALDDQWLKRYGSCTEFVAALKKAVQRGSTARQMSGSHRAMLV